MLTVFTLFAVLALPQMFYIFYLYQECIVIKYPLSFTSKTDEILQLTALEEGVFIRKKYKTHVIFSVNGKDLKYDFRREKADELFTHLTRLGIKTEKKVLSNSF